MNVEDVVAAVCLVIAAVSALALFLLSRPDSFLSRLVDGIDDPTREGNDR